MQSEEIVKRSSGVMFFRNVIFVSSLFLTLMSGGWLWAARIGWALLTVLFVLDIRYGIYSVFFFSAFFHKSGFLENSWFTLKHFHIAAALTCLIYGIRHGIHRDLWPPFKKHIKLFSYFGFILLIALFNFERFPVESTLYRIPLNLIFVLTLFFLISLLMIDYLKGRAYRPFLERCLNYFILGVCLQIGFGFYNTFFDTAFLGLGIIHNNHIGILAAISIFYPLVLSMQSTRWVDRFAYAMALLVIFCGLVASCSRTSWLSFVIGFANLTYFVYLFQQKSAGTSALHFPLKYVFLLFSFCIIALSLLHPDIYSRFSNLHQLLDPEYWAYTLKDEQNFGFLGRFRLNQLHALGEIVRNHPILGVGFQRYVVDFHGFIFVLLGATGFTGLALFLFFFFHILFRLWRMIWKINSGTQPALEIALYSVYVVWLFCSLMETYFLQFSVWINLLMATVFFDSKSLEVSRLNREQSKAYSVAPL